MASHSQTGSFQAFDKRILKPTTIDLIGGIYCHICNSTYSNKKEYDSHYVVHKIGDEETVYTCVVCHKQLPGYRSFREHCYNVHVSKDKFKCKYCLKMFSKLSVLNHHIAKVHAFTCLTCNDQFPTRNEWQMHQSKHKIVTKNMPPYSCKSCCESIDNIDMCELHIDDNCITIYQCPICEETMQNKPDIVKHLTNHFGDVLNEDDCVDEDKAQMVEDSSIDLLGGILCSICDEMFKNRMEFDVHFVLEHGDRELVYSCVMCKKQYNKYLQFINHCYFHLSKDRFECNDCGKTFSRLSLLVLHTEAFHSGGAVDKPFSCDKCGHRFKSDRRLRIHWHEVHAVRCMQCPEYGCGKTFESPKDLFLHQRHHKEINENYCRHCGLQLTTLSSCEKHLDMHRIKYYHCPVCDREYREKYLLLKHMPQHFETVLHICNICGKSYNARSRLIEHSKTHSASKSHTCSYCGKGFVKLQQLEQHVNVHTGLRPFKCTICPKAFASYPNWAKHLLRMHNLDHKVVKKAVVAENANAFTSKCDEANVDLGGESSSGVTSAEAERPAESDESTMDSIDPAVIERELQMFERGETQAPSEQLEFMEIMPLNNATFVPEAPQPAAESTFQASGVPPEYGPDFVNKAIEASSFHGEYIDLDDHIMPHIDPLLTIKNAITQDTLHYNHYERNVDFDYRPWEPPIITRVYENYHYEDVTEASKLSIMNTDIF